MGEEEILGFSVLKENNSNFIQIYVKDKPYLIFAFKNCGFYHGPMLEYALINFIGG